MLEITSREELEAWLEDQPNDRAQVIAARAALRILPYAFDAQTPQNWVEGSALSLIRVNAISWIAHNLPAHEMADAARTVAFDAAGAAGLDAAQSAVLQSAAAAAAYAGYTAYFVGTAAAASAHAVDAASVYAASVWAGIDADCRWLDSRDNEQSAARQLTRKALWLGGELDGWHNAWKYVTHRLRALDQGYDVWIDWYDRRISGNRAAFDIPGDTDRIEDKKILARLADATNKVFWDKGATYVNTTLQSWIDEARARIAALPEQDPAAITYGVNDRGQLDRLPAHDQQHLRDVPDQQFLYGRIREAAFDLLGEGQRLGVPLSRALNRFAVAMPEDFAAALALPLWAEGIILRRLYRAHRLAFESKELSSDQLEPVVAEGLGGLLDLYNHFAFGDDGLRAKDETTIPPQERPSAEAEAAAAAPLVAALLQTPEVAADIVIDDITLEADADTLPAGDPYADQLRDQTNRNWRNRVAAILTGLRKAIVVVGKETAKGTLSGVIAMGLTDAATGTQTLAALGQFVATNAQDFITYVRTVFPTYNLGPLIEQIARLFS